MSKIDVAVNQTEHECPVCNGTGFPPVQQPVQPGRKIYPAPCKKCKGKGRSGRHMLVLSVPQFDPTRTFGV